MNEFRLSEDETKRYGTHILYRVYYGEERGGWVQSKENLQYGGRVLDDSIVSGNAKVSDGAVVKEYAYINGDAYIFCGAEVSGSSLVTGNAKVGGYAVVSGGSFVAGNAFIAGNTKVSGVSSLRGDFYSEDNAIIYNASLTTGKVGRDAEIFTTYHVMSFMGLTHDPVNVYRTVGGGFAISVGCQTFDIDTNLEALADEHEYPLPRGLEHLKAFISEVTKGWAKDVRE